MTVQLSPDQSPARRDELASQQIGRGAWFVGLLRRSGLRARLVLGFVTVSLVGTLLAALLTIGVTHGQFADYLDRRAADATLDAARLAEQAYRDAGNAWSPAGIDSLAHELALTGYDFRLNSGGRLLLDTTKPRGRSVALAFVGAANLHDTTGKPVGRLETLALPGGGSTPADADFRRALDRVHVIAALAAGALAMIIGLLVSGRLARPLSRLAAAAGQLGKDRPPVRLREEGPPEVRAVASALSELAGDLDRQQRSRRQLAQDLAHELRTPLALIQSRIEAMQDGVVPFDPDGLATLHTEVIRLSHLIGQIEVLAETEAQPRPLAIRRVSLDGIAREHHDALAPAFELAGIVLTLDPGPALARADVDATHQIVGNLLSNALKYTPAGGTVTVRTTRDERGVSLSVANTGPGIDAPDPSVVFNRFYRTAGASSQGTGVGLGLSIAQQLTVAQGGTLEVSGSADRTVFSLRLPADTSKRSGDSPSPVA